MMTYEQALDYIHQTEKFGSKPGLLRVGALLKELGDPQDTLRFIHVAGTNGKGSTVAMTASVLREAGYRTGMYISPYVEDFCERIQLDGAMIARDELAARVSRVKALVEDMLTRGGPQPTEFEIITALALRYFADMKCDYVVLEVGLGGRWDATNIIAPGAVTVITALSLDHTKILGGTLPAIAHEKCGIIKEGCAAVSCAGQPAAAMQVIEETCAGLKVPLTTPDLSELKVLSVTLSGSDIEYRGQPLHIPLLGEHQIQNALTVCETVRALRRRGAHISDECLERGMAAAKWNGRLEIVRKKPLSIIDGAHNPAAISVLCAAMDDFFRDRPIILIMGMMGDKDYKRCIPMAALRARTFLAVAAHGERALPASGVAETAAGYCADTRRCDSMREAVATALALAGEDGVIIACGSLYIVGEIKALLQNDVF